MEIKDFIKDALEQIVDGVQQANLTLASKNAFVPTENVAGAEGYFSARVENGEPLLWLWLLALVVRRSRTQNRDPRTKGSAPHCCVRQGMQ